MLGFFILFSFSFLFFFFSLLFFSLLFFDSKETCKRNKKTKDVYCVFFFGVKIFLFRICFDQKLSPAPSPRSIAILHVLTTLHISSLSIHPSIHPFLSLCGWLTG
jgi:hypothetical protein